MINKINNLQELHAERLRLQYKRYELEGDMKNDIRLIKESLNPMQILRNQVNQFKNGDPGFTGNLIGAALGMGLNFVITNVLMRRSGFVKKIITSWLINKYGINLITKNSGTIFSGLKQLIGKLTSPQNKDAGGDVYDSTTADHSY